MVVFSDIDMISDAQQLFDRILKALEEPFVVNGHLITIGASIGASLYPDHGEEVEMLVRHADAAMYRSKANGRNQITYFKSETVMV